MNKQINLFQSIDSLPVAEPKADPTAKDLQPGQEFKLNPDSPYWFRLTKATVYPESDRMMIYVVALLDGDVKRDFTREISVPQKSIVYLKTT